MTTITYEVLVAGDLVESFDHVLDAQRLAGNIFYRDRSDVTIDQVIDGDRTTIDWRDVFRHY